MRKNQRARASARERGERLPTDRVDATEALDLVLRAVANGVTNCELGRMTGLSSQTFWDMRHRVTTQISRRTHDKIVRVLRDNTDLRDFKRGTRVPAHYTRTMIRALCAQGWTQEKQREVLQQNTNVSGGFIKGVTCDNYPHVYYANEQAIRWLVSQIGDARGPSRNSIAWGARNGYYPTKHYDFDGKLIVSSLPDEVRQGIEGV